ncbi:FAD-binding oxidoreductase [Agromyces tropicus]|uniref:FAD-binding oxidoreductase n=1 Tax=Agromyces tropicus TaxID=555371 RepID=A0ABN2U2K3_9MICO
MTTTTTIETRSVDDHGELMHADDATAQLCLSLVRLEAALSTRGLGLASVSQVRIHAIEPRTASELVELVLERFGTVATTPVVAWVGCARLDPPGTLVRLAADVPADRPTGRPAGPPTRRPADAPTHRPADPPNRRTDMNPSLTDTSTLRAAGAVHLPGDPGYEAATMPWNLAVVQRPAAVAIPRSADEVARVVAAATALGLRIAPQGTGHGAAALAARPLDDAVLVRMHEFTGVTVDPVARTARVLGGTLWRDVVAAAAPHGLAALHGSAGDVAVAGYALGGGLSFYGRAHGLASSHVRAVELVTADGTIVRASADERPELLWALRGGGGGSFGVVVAVELDLIPVADVVAGMLLWDLSRGPEVARAWSRWTAGLPESATTSLRFMRFPPDPAMPPFLRGRSLVVVDGAILEDDEGAAELLAPLRALDPEIDTFARIPAAGLVDVHMDPPGPVPAVSDHALLAELPDAAIDALVGVAGPGVEIPLMFAELRHLGGALARPADGALARLDGAYALFAASPAPTPEMAAAGTEATSAVAAALSPWSTGGAFLNFADREVAVASAFGADDWERLVEVRREVDPDGVFAAAHPIEG